MPVRRPKGSRPERKPRANFLKCGFKRPPSSRGFQSPTAVPYIVTRYLGAAGSQSVIDEQEKGAAIIPSKIVGHEEVGSFCQIYVESESTAAHQRRRSDSPDPDTDPDVLAFAPWTFRIQKSERNTIRDFLDLAEPVTVLRLPEVEVARPVPGAMPYGINPARVSILLAMDEMPLAARAAFVAKEGYDPDFNCFTEHFQVWDNRVNAPFCKGDGCKAQRRDDDGQYSEVACIPWEKDPDTGQPNPHVCQYRGEWSGTSFKKPRNPCKFATQFAFRVAGVPTLWLYQVYTTSETTAGNIRPMLNAVLGYRRDGRVTGFPMELSVELKTFTPTVDGKTVKTEKPIWKLDVDGRVLQRVDQGSVAAYLDGGATQVALPAPPPDALNIAGEDLSDFHVEEPDEPKASWSDRMMEHKEVLQLFRALKYTRGKGREVLSSVEGRHGAKGEDHCLKVLLTGLRKAVAKQEESSAPEPEQQAPEPEAPSQGELLDASGQSLDVDKEGVQSMPDESDFL